MRTGEKIYHVVLSNEARLKLFNFTHSGFAKVREIIRANILLQADTNSAEGSKSDNQIAKALGISKSTVALTRKKFNDKGLEGALKDAPRSGHPEKLSGKDKAMLTAIACSSPPEGRNRWTLTLLADRMVVLNYVDHISRETIRQALKKTTLNHG